MRDHTTVSKRGYPYVPRCHQNGIAQPGARLPRLLSVGLLSAVLLFAEGVSAEAVSLESRPVRVRIASDQQRVTIADAKGTSVQVAAGPAGLTVDGRSAGAVWRTGESGLYRVKTRPGGDALQLRGRLALYRTPTGLSVINEVSLENYVVGTLGAEMYASWAAAALQAQAVACRSYALYQMARRSDRGFDVEADVRSQRYLGVRGESDSAWAAVRATTGQIISYDGQPALAAFHSASGGRTASAKEVWGTSIPYLRSVPVENEDDSPDTYWRASVSDEDLGEMLAQLGHDIGPIASVKVANRSASGRVRELRFRGGKGRATVTGRELRQVLGGATIKSTMFDVRFGLRREAGEVLFVGSGNGHGVGMSQWAAQAMAEEGADYREILGNFYPGTDLVSIAEQRRRFAKLPAVSGPGKPARTELPTRLPTRLSAERGSTGEQSR